MLNRAAQMLRTPLKLLIHVFDSVVHEAGALGLVRLTDFKHRHRRRRLLQRSLRRTTRLKKTLDFRQGLYIDPTGQHFVLSDEVLLSTLGTNRFLKVSGKNSGNEGKELADFLADQGIRSPNVIIDIGANVGEITLYFARHFPAARVIAIEPSPTNLALLRHNINQQFWLPKIEILEVAVSSTSGTAPLLALGAESSLKRSKVRGVQAQNVDEVATLRLLEVFTNLSISTADFVKIDIEGGEVDLVADLDLLANRSRVWLIECADWNSFSAFAPIICLFGAKGFRIARRNGLSFSSTSEALEDLRESPGGDWWFVRP